MADSKQTSQLPMALQTGSKQRAKGQHGVISRQQKRKARHTNPPHPDQQKVTRKEADSLDAEILARTHLRSRPGKGAHIVQGGQELSVHDLGQPNIRNLGSVVPGQQDVG